MVRLLTAALLVETAFAFPHIAEMLKERELEDRIDSISKFPEYPGKPNHATFNKFDAKAQLIDVHGAHEWRAPGPDDIRGPCAGLNAAANHGYLPRDGIATAKAINNGLFEAFSLDKTATIFLETATRFFDGNPLTGEWSIGYASDKVNPPLAKLLGEPTGICNYGHLKTEGDASITRGDFLAPTQNSNCRSYPNFVRELFALARKMNKKGWLTPRVFAQHQYNRKQHSIKTNPLYFSPAYAGVAFTFGAHMFAYQLLANHSKEYPRGFMTPNNFLSLWAYKRGPNGSLQYTYGHERIPENYYKRSEEDVWDLADITISTAQQCTAFPSNCQVGGNTGEVNSFSGVDLGDTTGGLINSATDLQDPDRMACFISQAIQADVPGYLEKLFVGPGLKIVQNLVPRQLLPALANIGACPNMPKGKTLGQYGKKYPGAKVQTSGPRAHDK